MAIAVELAGGRLGIKLTGVDGLLTGRREVVILASQHVTSAEVVPRGALEPWIDHRRSGLGPHNGAKRPGHRRVGAMEGQLLPGVQFWAVPAGPAGRELLVLELRQHEFARAVLAVEHPDRMVVELTGPPRPIEPE